MSFYQNDFTEKAKMPTMASTMLSRGPKNTFVTKNVLEIAVNFAIIYNNVIMQFTINGGRFMKKFRFCLDFFWQWEANIPPPGEKRPRKLLVSKISFGHR